MGTHDSITAALTAIADRTSSTDTRTPRWSVQVTAEMPRRLVSRLRELAAHGDWVEPSDSGSHHA